MFSIIQLGEHHHASVLHVCEVNYAMYTFSHNLCACIGRAAKDQKKHCRLKAVCYNGE